jgi:hypothetical protein
VHGIATEESGLVEGGSGRVFARGAGRLVVQMPGMVQVCAPAVKPRIMASAFARSMVR